MENLPKQCFARAARRCRESEGHNGLAERWHAVSSVEHFCSDCVAYYSGGGKRATLEYQAVHGRCSVKDMIPRLHLPVYVQCEAAQCGKWRALPPLTVPSELAEGWHCGLWAVASSRTTRRKCGSCDAAEDKAVSELALPAAELAEAPVPQLVATCDVAAMQAAVLDARMPWWELTPAETLGFRSCPELQHCPRRALAIRNLLLLLWSRRRAAGRLTVSDSRRFINASGLARVWCSAALPAVYHTLRRLGVINFHAGPRLSLTVPLSEKRRPVVSLTVIVVGAGIAGLAAARQLRYESPLAECMSRP